MTKRTTSLVLTAAFLAAVSSSHLIAADPPPQIGVIVKAADSGSPADRFLVVDPEKDDVVKEVEKALRKSPDLLVVTNQQPGDPPPITIVLGVSNVCVTTGRTQPSRVARQLIWFIDTDDAVITNRVLRPPAHTRFFAALVPTVPSPSYGGEGLCLRVAANRSALLAGRQADLRHFIVGTAGHADRKTR